MKRRTFISLLGGAAVARPLAARAQQVPKGRRIGVLVAASAAAYASRIEALRMGLRELGYVEGKDIAFDYRYADSRYDRLFTLAQELIAVGPDVLVTHGTPGTRAAKQATVTIPIVMAISGDAIATGLVTSLARPDGNVTGSTFFNPELAVKRLEVLKEAIPSVGRVGVLVNPNNPINGPVLAALRAAAKSLKIELQYFETRTSADFEPEFSKMAAAHLDAIALTDDATLTGSVAQIAELAARYRIASTGFTELAAAGGLIGYGANFHVIFHRAAYFVDRILKGAKPGDLPVEQSSKFDLAINLRTAKALGLELPPSLLAIADEVIE